MQHEYIAGNDILRVEEAHARDSWSQILTHDGCKLSDIYLIPTQNLRCSVKHFQGATTAALFARLFVFLMNENLSEMCQIQGVMHQSNAVRGRSVALQTVTL